MADCRARGPAWAPLLGDAVSLRSAASVASAFFGVRRASEVARLLGYGARVDLADGFVDLEMKRRKEDQFGASQLALPRATDSWAAACPAQLPPR